MYYSYIWQAMQLVLSMSSKFVSLLVSQVVNGVKSSLLLLLLLLPLIVSKAATVTYTVFTLHLGKVSMSSRRQKNGKKLSVLVEPQCTIICGWILSHCSLPEGMKLVSYASMKNVLNDKHKCITLSSNNYQVT